MQVNYNELFEYKDGRLFWKQSHGRSKAGSEAGYLCANGRRYVRVDKKLQLVHRVIWTMHYGDCPEFLDHIDGNPLNNHIENLRPATKQQNAQNRKVRCTNQLKTKGVQVRGSKFASYIWVNKQQKYLGTFETLDEAGMAYMTAAKTHHKEFASCRS
jgi:hypothetical protein